METSCTILSLCGAAERATPYRGRCCGFSGPGGQRGTSASPRSPFSEDLSDEYAGPTAGAAHWSWLERTLSNVKADGLALQIVVGHRPVFSLADRARTEAERSVERRLLDLLRSKATPSMPLLYLHGHDHVMQHFSELGGLLQHIGNGVGGMGLHAFVKGSRGSGSYRWGSEGKHGFIVHEVGSESMASHFIDAETRSVLYTAKISLAQCAV